MNGKSSNFTLKAPRKVWRNTVEHKLMQSQSSKIQKNIKTWWCANWKNKLNCVFIKLKFQVKILSRESEKVKRKSRVLKKKICPRNFDQWLIRNRNIAVYCLASLQSCSRLSCFAVIFKFVWSTCAAIAFQSISLPAIYMTKTLIETRVFHL